jgi:DNA-binding transcriptional ArsR family regulator
MAGILPSELDEEYDDSEGDPRVVGVDTTDADEVLGALSSGTARRLLTALHDDPSTPSELAKRADTSLQNTQYHLDKLVEADLIEVQGTRYSAKGREMSVYAPKDGPLVLFAGDEEESAGVQAALAQLLGGVGVLSMTGGILKWWIGRDPSPPSAGPGGGTMSVAPDATIGNAASGTIAPASPGGSASLASVESVVGSLPATVMIALGLTVIVGLVALNVRK